MKKSSWILVLFLPVVNSALLGFLLPIYGFQKPILTTISDILEHPFFWLGKRVTVKGRFFQKHYRFLLDTYPFKESLVDDNGNMIGLVLPYERKVSHWDWLVPLLRPNVLDKRVTGVVRITFRLGFSIYVDVETVGAAGTGGSSSQITA